MLKMSTTTFFFLSSPAEHCFSLSFSWHHQGRQASVDPLSHHITLEIPWTPWQRAFFLSQSLLSVSNSPLQTQLTNLALISCMRCVFLFVTRWTHRASLVTSVESNKRQVKEHLVHEMTKLQCNVVKMYTKKCPLFHIEWIQCKFTFRFSH